MIKLGIPGLIKVLDYITNKNHTSQTTASMDIPPQPPTLSPLPDATFSAQIKVAGIAQSNMQVKLSVNDKQTDTKTTDDNGNFSFDAVPLNKGDNRISVIAYTPNNTPSQATTANVAFDNTPPQLTITTPQDEANLAGPDQKMLTITGKVDKGDTNVRINNNFVPTSSDGTFSYPTQLQDGSNEFNIVATDQAGNQTTHLLRVHYTL